MRARVFSHWFGGLGSRNGSDPVDPHSRRILPDADATVAGNDPSSDGYCAEAEGTGGNTRIGTRSARNYRLQAILAGLGVTAIFASGAITLSLIPEIAKTLGTDGVILALLILVVSGAGIAYLFWRLTAQILRQHMDFIQDIRKDYKLQAREQRDAYERGLSAGRNQPREDRDRTPAEGLRK